MARPHQVKKKRLPLELAPRGRLCLERNASEVLLSPASRLEDEAMNVFENVVANEQFVLPKHSWIIPGLTLGASLVAVALALS